MTETDRTPEQIKKDMMVLLEELEEAEVMKEMIGGLDYRNYSIAIETDNFELHENRLVHCDHTAMIRFVLTYPAVEKLHTNSTQKPLEGVDE